MSRKGERFSKLYESFWRNPKRRRLSLGATGLYCVGLSVTRDMQRDGVIPKYMLGAMTEGHADPQRLVDELTAGDSPFWIDRGEVWEIHDWTADNETEAQIAKRRKSARDRKSRERAKAAAPASSRATGPPPVTEDVTRDIAGDVTGDVFALDGDGEIDPPQAPPGGLSGGSDSRQLGAEMLKAELGEEFDRCRKRVGKPPAIRPKPWELRDVAEVLLRYAEEHGGETLETAAEEQHLEPWRLLARLTVQRHFAAEDDFVRRDGWSFKSYAYRLSGYLEDLAREAAA